MSTNDNIDSLISYSAATCGFTIATLADVASVFQSLIVILTFCVVLFRMVYDGIRLYRFIKQKG